jgi:hypothetical protein
VAPLTITPAPALAEAPAFVHESMLDDLKAEVGRMLNFRGELRPALAEGLMTCHDSRLRGPA